MLYIVHLAGMLPRCYARNQGGFQVSFLGRSSRWCSLNALTNGVWQLCVATALEIFTLAVQLE